jgi:hypothetical protein
MALTQLESYMVGPTASTSKITSLTYPSSTTAANPAGGETLTITGSGFSAGATVYVDTTSCATTYVSATSLTFTAPAKSLGSYHLYVYNTDGSFAIKPGGYISSSIPIWVTASGALTTAVVGTAYSQSVNATGDGTITYSLTSGSLSTGLSLNASTGAITGTPSSEGTSTFTITATDSQNQTSSRSFSILASNIITADYLLLAGGGSGGTGYYGGGGGAGGYLEATSIAFTKGTVFTVTIGAGGVGTTTQTNRGGNGGNSSISGSGFTTVTAIGGGGGGSRNGDANSANAQGASGGSGGGASYVQNIGGTGVYPDSSFLSQARQGYDGGATNSDSTFSAGGGGAGGPGQGATGSPPRAAGPGLASSITGTSVYRGGGGGNAYGTSYPGLGGGGAVNTAGTANTGGGGGGGAGDNTQGGNGGSGVVIIRYADSSAEATSTTGSPTYTTPTGYRVYTFTSSGSITF